MTLEALVGVSHEAPLGGFRVTGVRVADGAWLEVETHRHDGRGTEGALFLFGHRRLDDPRALPFARGLLAALSQVIDRATPRTIGQWAIGWLDVRMPLEVLTPGATSDAYCAEFLRYAWLGRLLPDRPTKPPPFERAPVEAIVRGNELDLDALFAWIQAQAQRTYEDPRWDDARIRALPAPARVLEGLHLLDAMVGGNGFEVFLAQARGADVRHCLAALEAVDAPRLLHLLREGIALAASQGAEFTNERSRKWLEAFEDPSAHEWSTIDGHEPDRSYALLATELRPAASRFAERHRARLLR